MAVRMPADSTMPRSMSSLGDGLAKAIDRLARGEEVPEGSDPDRFASTPDRDLANAEIALHQMHVRLTALDFSPRHVERLRSDAAEAIAKLHEACESPIERAISPWLVTHVFGVIAPPNPVFLPEVDDPCRHGLFIVPQLRFGRYRLDFAVTIRREERAKIVALECDGAEFHDPFRDAARDAYLRSFGIEVIRATGRQIAENPIRVVARVEAALWSEIWS